MRPSRAHRRTRLPRMATAALACSLAALAACSGDEQGQGQTPDAGDASADLDATADGPADAESDATEETDGEADALTDTAEPDADRPALRVVTLNLRCLIDDWDLRFPIVVAALAELDPDLVGFQEACAEPGADNLAELVQALALETGRSYGVERTVTHRSWQRYDEGIAVVSALPILDTEVVALPGGVFTRKIVMTRVQTVLGDLVFATTHLDHQSADARAGQIEAALSAFDGFAETGEARILTGDLNEGPTGGSVAPAVAEAGFLDSWAVLAPAGDPGLTAPASAPVQRIDYVWLDSGDTELAARSCDVFLDTPVDGVFGSDHFGVTAVVGH